MSSRLLIAAPHSLCFFGASCIFPLLHSGHIEPWLQLVPARAEQLQTR
jgi:hypothetical protein